MAARLIIVFINILAPTLSADSWRITPSDRVHLNCQTIFSDSVCYFIFDNLPTYQQYSCQHSWGGRQLLSLVKQSSAADITVTCFYYRKYDWSQYSNRITISIRDPSPPSLTVKPSVITETDSVTLHCRPPDAATVTLCYFFNAKGLGETSSSCQVTVRGSDLLKSQTPPAEVTVQCYYKTRGKQDNSPYSSPQTVTIQNAWNLMLQHPSTVYLVIPLGNKVSLTKPEQKRTIQLNN
ncbi:hypothetical protein WMY93_033555 [Mugilogobius chulae]|uniref:Ig-like domain-containing protein n=1 Tax=Mugilogobius chulae TaxID=88201 RepID=A0AAW0MH05_9GOBI